MKNIYIPGYLVLRQSSLVFLLVSSVGTSDLLVVRLQIPFVYETCFL